MFSRRFYNRRHYFRCQSCSLILTFISLPKATFIWHNHTSEPPSKIREISRPNGSAARKNPSKLHFRSNQTRYAHSHSKPKKAVKSRSTTGSKANVILYVLLTSRKRTQEKCFLLTTWLSVSVTNRPGPTRSWRSLMGYFLVCSEDPTWMFWDNLIFDLISVVLNVEPKNFIEFEFKAFLAETFFEFFHTFLRITQWLLNISKRWLFHKKGQQKTYQN